MRHAVFVFITIAVAWPLSVFAQESQPGQAYNLSTADQKQFSALSQSQRDDLVQQSYNKWQGMGTAEKKGMEEQATSDFSSLPTAEQQKMKADALRQWQGMSREQQDELRSTFPDMLKGNLELDPGS